MEGLSVAAYIFFKFKFTGPTNKKAVGDKRKFKEMQVQLAYQAKIKQRQRSRNICIRKLQNAPLLASQTHNR